MTKIINEHKVNGMPNLLTTKGVKTSHPKGTDKRGYNAHVIDRSIAKFTIRQVKIATRQAIEKILKINFPVSSIYVFFTGTPRSGSLRPLIMAAEKEYELQFSAGEEDVFRAQGTDDLRT